MQQTPGMKHFVATHVAATALAFGVLVSGAVGVAGLVGTGNLPMQQVSTMAPTSNTTASRIDWFQSTHRHWTPEVQMRLTTSGRGVDHIPPRLRP
jgi:hypothetical protein